MAPPNVKIDNLFGNLKELQKGRLSLEQNLEELRAKKRGLESALEEASARQAQAKYVNLKMRETLKIAQHKVNQTQQQHASIRVEADAKGKRVSQLNKRIEGERGKQTEEMLQFGEQIADLSERFTSAKNYHSDESLQQQISQTGQESFGFETKEAVSTAEVEELQKQQSENVQEQETAEAEAVTMGIDKGDQMALLHMVDGECSHQAVLTEHITGKAAQLEGKLEDLQLSGTHESEETKM